MIPKIIHYCWFGCNEKPKSVIKMINSWRKHCPDYEIKEWNESNFDVDINKYTREAYYERKWAFVSDVARLYAIYTEGGIYMDTDVELIKSLDDLLTNNAFAGFEGTEWIGTNIIGATANNPIIKDFLKMYDNISFKTEDNKLNQTTNVERFTQILKNNYNLIIDGREQQLKYLHVYPTDYFCPYDYINGKLNITHNTFSIHWYSQSWIKRGVLKRKISQLYHRLTGIRMK
ncbi:MAG: hypothetical protein IJN66_06710 [Muribaculaceae bacterium]|nr:hypothetical protein [Muribaculaceae bacterium]